MNIEELNTDIKLLAYNLEDICTWSVYHNDILQDELTSITAAFRKLTIKASMLDIQEEDLILAKFNSLRQEGHDENCPKFDDDDCKCTLSI